MRAITLLAASLALTACSKGPTAAAPDPAVEGRAFLTKNAHAPGIVVTHDGLQYRILRSGPASGIKPKLADEVKVDYEAKLLDGQVVDSSFERGQPAVMTVRDLIPGWQEALQLMRKGDEWLIYVPAKLGYGDKGAGPIPPGSVLMFKLDLIDVLPDQSSVGRG
jgi:peptidylprolyl isomerase/FKBP-type peptidyl-prolyl cis-trans isomerase FklB